MSSADLRIGSIDQPDYALTMINDVEVADNGDIVIAQPMEYTIRVYDRQGRFKHSIGRDGDGPGEFRNIRRLQHLAGSLFVVDRGLRRLSEFTADGDYVRAWTPPNYDYPPDLAATPPTAVMEDMSFIDIRTYLSDDTRQVPVLHFDSAGRFIGNIASMNVAGQSRRVEVDGLQSVLPQPVSTHTLRAVDRNGSSVVLVNRTSGDLENHGEVHVVRIDAAGDTTLSRRYAVPVRRIDRTDLADTIRSIARRIARVRPFPESQIAELYHKGWDIPDFQSPVDEVVAAANGHIWLRQGAFLAAEALWWVLDIDGELIARLTIPTSLHVMRVGTDSLWGVETGEHGESYVVRMWIVRK